MNKIGEKSKISKPFLRWAGGKNWLIKDFDTYLPLDGYNNYHEPFIGGGAVFFYLSPNVSFLSDLNHELIETYQVLKDDVNGVIQELSKYRNTEDFYYFIRTKRYKSEVQRASRFIYLNQTSFNGIFRVNLKGEYNVPFGYRKKNFLQVDNLKQASFALRNAQIKSRDFMCSIDDINAGDLIFLDPPYTVTHNNNGFIKYNAKLFDLDAQKRLSIFIDTVNEIGAYYILTNAAHKEIENIFSKPGRNRKIETSRASLVGGLNAKRDRYSEYIFTNI